MLLLVVVGDEGCGSGVECWVLLRWVVVKVVEVVLSVGGSGGRRL